jgi:hypothetical protein
MKGIYAQYKTDATVEKEGVLYEVGTGPNGEPVYVRLARAGGGNVAFAKLLEAKLKPHKRAIQNDALDREVADRIMREVYASTVILGWENVTDENGSPLAFTKENVLKVLTDLPDLWTDIKEQSQRAALYREMEREADAGN